MSSDRVVTDFFARYKRTHHEVGLLEDTCARLRKRVAGETRAMEQAEEQLAEALETEAALQKKHRAATERLQGEQSQKETLEAEIADLRAEVRCAEQRGQRAAKVAGNRRLQLQRSRQERQDLQSRAESLGDALDATNSQRLERRRELDQVRHELARYRHALRQLEQDVQRMKEAVTASIQG